MTFTDPGADLQRSIVAALKASQEVSAIVAAPGVYDQVPRNKDGDPNVGFPYVAFGETQTAPELAECTDAAETFITLHAWSRKVGSVEIKQLAAAVIKTLHDQEVGGTQSLLLQESRIIRDPDGITSHGIITFQILTDAN